MSVMIVMIIPVALAWLLACCDCQIVNPAIYPEDDSQLLSLTFPEDFQWFVGTSAYQTEGAWNESGKGESIWDRFCHVKPSKILDGSTADVACDSYHRFEEDLGLVKQLGIGTYRFSLSWPRLWPTGRGDRVNPDGVIYYRRIMDTLKKYGLDYQVTLHHFDLPQPLQDQGGWLNESSIAWFRDYAQFCFQTFPEVKFWYSINQPHVMASNGYEDGSLAPGLRDDTGRNFYIAAKNQLLAHAEAYRVYHQKYNKDGKGKLAPCYDGIFKFPRNATSPTDLAATERALAWTFGIFMHPIYSSKGGWPPIVLEQMDKIAREQNTTNRLVKLTKEEIQTLKGSADFLGYNYYSSELIYQNLTSYPPGSVTDPRYSAVVDPDWVSYAAPDRPVTPWALRKALNWFASQYGTHWDMYIVENGVTLRSNMVLNDSLRSQYYRLHLAEAYKVINYDGLKLKGYGIWSFLDNFEWDSGYTQKYGIVHVDFNDPNRTRTAKDSFYYLKNVIATNCFIAKQSELDS